MSTRHWTLRLVAALLLATGGAPAAVGQGIPSDADALRPWHPEDRPGAEDAAPRPEPPEPVPVHRNLTSKHGHAPEHVIVQYRRDVPSELRPLLSRDAGGWEYRPARFAPFARVEVAPGDDPQELVARLAAQPEVEWAELDPICWTHFDGNLKQAQFNDPLLPRQWSYERINLLPALARNPGMGQGVVVAVIDTGVAFGTGPTFPTRRGLDLEGTAFVPGWDFVDNNPFPFDLGHRIDNPNDPLSRRFGHGTFAAAQIAATANNGIAGIGVAPRAAIMPLRVLGIRGFGTFSDVAEAIHFATNNGARVINMSLGGEGGSTPLLQAVRAAHQAGVVLVASAGNEAQAQDAPADVGFPARYAEVLAVGATRFDGQRAAYSNTGPGVDLMAPAGQGLVERPGNVLDAALSTSFLHHPASGETNHSAFWSTGTSFAAPQVAGAAALIIGLGVTDGRAVERMLLDTARNLGSPGFDEQHGWGLLDVFEAHLGLGL
jgi:hypothetical protein